MKLTKNKIEKDIEDSPDALRQSYNSIAKYVMYTPYKIVWVLVNETN